MRVTCCSVLCGCVTVGCLLCRHDLCVCCLAMYACVAAPLVGVHNTHGRVDPIKGAGTNLLVLSYPTHCPTPLTPPPFLWLDTKLWLLGNYSLHRFDMLTKGTHCLYTWIHFSLYILHYTIYLIVTLNVHASSIGLQLLPA